MSPGEGIRDNVIFTRDVLHFESVHHGLQLHVHNPWVWYFSQVLLVTKNGKQWFVINAEDEILQSEDEKFAF